MSVDPTDPNVQARESIDKLAAFIISEVKGEPRESQGAVDTAIRVIGEMREEIDQARGLLSTVHGLHPDRPLMEAVQLVVNKRV